MALGYIVKVPRDNKKRTGFALFPASDEHIAHCIVL